jgi:hypothetical protein
MSSSITTSEAQRSADLCSGINAPVLSNITEENALSERNKFLSNVAYNGWGSHEHIISVLQWFSQFS